MPTRELLALLPVFDAVFSEGNLSRAADRLGVTQSAVSQSLARLRNILNDDLFESTGRGMRPTPRALVIVRHVRAALAEVDAVVEPKETDIAKLERTFVLDIGAGFDVIVLPVLYPELARQAPHVRLLISNTRGTDLTQELKFGETELAFDFMANPAEGIKSELVASVPTAVIARDGHPALRRGLSKEAYFNLGHAALIWNRSAAASGVALELARRGFETNVVVSVPTLMALGAVVATSDLIATTSITAARELANHYDLRIYPIPFPFPPATLYQIWHVRYEEDAGHVWLRETIKTLGKSAVE